MSISEPIQSDSSRRQPDKRTKRRKRSRSMAPNKLIILPLDLGESSPSQKAHEFFRLVRQDDKSGAKKSDFSPIIVYIGHEDNRGQDHLHLMLRIEDRTTVEDLRDAVPLVLTMRDLLLEFQGPWVAGGDTLFFENLCRDKEDGDSWGRLADRFNSQLASDLIDWSTYLEDYQKASPSFKTYWEYMRWSIGHGGLHSLNHANNLLRLMKLPDSEIDMLCSDGLERIGRGEPPFAKGYPIDADELRTTLRSWQKGKLHNYHIKTEKSGEPQERHEVRKK